MLPYIVADIGGTNARFGLVKALQDNQAQIGDVQVLNGSEYPSLQDAMRAYIEILGIPTPKVACVAIAGPIEGDNARMTNLNWSFQRSEVKREFSFARFDVINDFASLSVATSKLAEEDLIPVKDGVRDKKGNKAILGPGTGLGVAGLAYSDRAWLPIASEGGHVNIAPANELECEVLQAAMRVHGHVSAEVFISGPGFVRLYNSLAVVRDQPAQELGPEDITSAALNGSDPLCVETLNLFCSFIGTLSGNLALTYGAKGGVYLAGGILPRFVDFLRTSDFSTRFSSKGVMSHYVKDIPVSIIAHEQPGLLGSAAWLTG